jgi:putative DNA primase/helicase
MAVARVLIDAIFMTAHGPRLRYHRGIPYSWGGDCWVEIAGRDVRRDAYHFLEDAQYVDPEGGVRPWSPTQRKIDDLLDALQAVTLVESALDSPLWLDRRGGDPAPDEIVSMRNGLLHVPSRTLLSHTPRFFNHNVLPFEFLPEAPAPRRWLEFLSALWPEDESSIMILQEVIGYLLAGGTNLHKIFLLVGPKRAGKGTIGRVLTALLGKHNVAGPTLSSLATNFGLSPLIDKPLALVADARLSARSESHIVVERLLSISGEDCLTVDRKYLPAWTGPLPTRFLILTNELPRLSDASGALASRFVLLVLTKSFYGAENPRLTNELIAEAPSIFMWALAGLDRLRTRGYFEQPESSREALQRLDDLASPIGAFLRANCIIATDARVSSQCLWDTWKRWCEAENRHPGTRTVFGRDLHAAAPTIRRLKARDGDERRWEYIGIGVAASADHSSEDLRPLGPPTAEGPKGPGSPASYVSGGEDDEAITHGRF